jgi:hypothetical protein
MDRDIKMGRFGSYGKRVEADQAVLITIFLFISYA